jgi:hypothetical protein
VPQLIEFASFEVVLLKVEYFDAVKKRPIEILLNVQFSPVIQALDDL